MLLLCRLAARDKGTLHSLGITHIVNAAHRPSNALQQGLYVNTGPRFYRDMKVDYYAVEADDASNFMLSPFFYPTARFIRVGLAQGGKSPSRTLFHKFKLSLAGMDRYQYQYTRKICADTYDQYQLYMYVCMTI